MRDMKISEAAANFFRRKKHPIIPSHSEPRLVGTNPTESARYIASNLDIMPDITSETKFEPYMRHEVGGLAAHIIHAIVDPIDRENLRYVMPYVLNDSGTQFDVFATKAQEGMDLSYFDPRIKVANVFANKLWAEIFPRYENIIKHLHDGDMDGQLQNIYDRYSKIFPLYRAYLAQSETDTNGNQDEVILRGLEGEMNACKWLFNTIPKLHTAEDKDVPHGQKPEEYAATFKNSYPTLSTIAKSHIRTVRGITFGLFPGNLKMEHILAVLTLEDIPLGRKVALRYPIEEVKEYLLKVTGEPAFPDTTPTIECPALAVINKGNALKKVFDMFADSTKEMYDFQFEVSSRRRTREEAFAIKSFFTPAF